MPPPSSSDPGPEGQVETSGLATANFSLSCHDFLGLRQVGSEQAAKYKLFLACMTPAELGESLQISKTTFLLYVEKQRPREGKGLDQHHRLS